MSVAIPAEPDSSRDSHPARPRDAAATRERLLDAAEAQFAAHGFAGSRVDEIAHAAGINVQLIYRYFGDKAGLHQAVFDRIYLQAARMLVQKASEIASDLPGREQFARRVGDYFDFVWTHPNFASFGLWALAEGIVPSADGPSEGLQAMSRIAEQILTNAIAAGVIRSDVTAELLIGMLISLCLAQYKCLSAHCGSGIGLDPEDPAVRDRMRGFVISAVLGAFGR